MKTNSNINYTVKNNLCVGCGICPSACPTDSIKMIIKKGQHIPNVDSQTCIKDKGCNKCLTICPGVEVALKEIGDNCFSHENAEYREKTGYYYSSYSGYSLDKDIRFRSASGGLVTQFLIYLLDKGYISGAVVTTFDNEQPLMSKTIIAHTKEELIAAKSSKYAPVSHEGIIEQVKKEDGEFVIVGLPCHIHGYRKYENIDKRFKKKIFGYFGLYCSGGRSFYLTEYVFKNLCIQRKRLSYFAYRDNGCLGSLNAIEKIQGNEVVTQVPYQLFYHPLRSFFTPIRCNLCVDHYAELADVAFGDIHYGKFKEDKIGINSVLIRTHKFDNLLQEAIKLKYIFLEELDYETLIKCQKSIKKKKGSIGTFIKLHEILGNTIPKYDVKVQDDNKAKSILSYFFARIQSYIGNRKRLWCIISFLKRKTKVDSI